MNSGNLPFRFAVLPFPTGPSNYSGATWSAGLESGFTLPWAPSDWNPSDILMLFEEFFSWPGLAECDTIIHEQSMFHGRNTFHSEDDLLRWVHNASNARRDIGNTVTEFLWTTQYFADVFLRQEMTALQAVEYHWHLQYDILYRFYRWVYGL